MLHHSTLLADGQARDDFAGGVTDSIGKNGSYIRQMRHEL